MVLNNHSVMQKAESKRRQLKQTLCHVCMCVRVRERIPDPKGIEDPDIHNYRPNARSPCSNEHWQDWDNGCKMMSMTPS